MSYGGAAAAGFGSMVGTQIKTTPIAYALVCAGLGIPIATPQHLH